MGKPPVRVVNIVGNGTYRALCRAKFTFRLFDEIPKRAGETILLVVLLVADIVFRRHNKRMSTHHEKRVGPSDIAPEEQSRLERMLLGDVRPVLLTTSGDVIELPKVLNDLFVSVVQAMRQKQAVFLMHEDEAFTTQAAANFLGVSRQYFVRLLEEGRIPYHHVGTHRRVFFKDLMAYQRQRSQSRKAALDRMTEEVVAAGLDEPYLDLTRPEDEQPA
jgi:excisionase family DNA binding protein